jgi:hypothetical protein
VPGGAAAGALCIDHVVTFNTRHIDVLDGKCKSGLCNRSETPALLSGGFSVRT